MSCSDSWLSVMQLLSRSLTWNILDLFRIRLIHATLLLYSQFSLYTDYAYVDSYFLLNPLDGENNPFFLKIPL